MRKDILVAVALAAIILGGLGGYWLWELTEPPEVEADSAPGLMDAP